MDFYAELEKKLINSTNHANSVAVASALIKECQAQEQVSHDLDNRKLARGMRSILMDSLYPRRDAYCSVCKSWGCWSQHEPSS